jgi:hypothetical protein
MRKFVEDFCFFAVLAAAGLLVLAATFNANKMSRERSVEA